MTRWTWRRRGGIRGAWSHPASHRAGPAPSRAGRWPGRGRGYCRRAGPASVMRTKKYKIKML